MNRTKILVLMLFCAISTMAQRQEVPLEGWICSQDGKNWNKVTPALAKKMKGKECRYRCIGIVENKFEHAELQFESPMKDADITVNGEKIKDGERSSKGYRVDVSNIFRQERVLERRVELPNGEQMLDGPGMMKEVEKQAVVEVETKENFLSRPVKLVASGLQGYGTRIDDWSVSARTLSSSASVAVVEVSATPLDAAPKDSLSFTIYSPDDKYVTHEIVPAKSGEPSTVRLEIANPQLSTDKKSYTYEVDLSLFATANSFKTGQPEAVPRDSYRKAFTIKAAPMASHPAFGKERPGRKKKARR